MDIRKEVDAARRARGLSYRALAQEADLDPGHLYRWLMGRKDLSSARLQRVLTVLRAHLVLEPDQVDGLAELAAWEMT